MLLFTIYLLILAGALVRVTGSGMGCPDWPKCFDQFIPPTQESQLRSDYQAYYQKQTGHEIAKFNVFHTYIEYINRLIAVFTGIIALIMMYFSLSYKKSNRKLIWFSALILFSIAFEGWLGKQVVASNLKSFVVTIHMLVSLVIVFLLIYLAVATSSFKSTTQLNLNKLRNFSFIMLLLTATQILLGTQVREHFDSVASRIDNRYLWIETVGISFYIHRTFSWLLLLGSLYLFFKTKSLDVTLFSASRNLLLTFLLQFITGIIMNYFGVPLAAQALHLLIGCISFGVICYLNIQLNPQVKAAIAK